MKSLLFCFARFFASFFEYLLKWNSAIRCFRIRSAQLIKAILIHGNGGSKPTDNWFPYLKRELEKIGIKTEAPQFPDADLARASYWIPFLKDTLKADEKTIIIGHSSGAIAAMKFAEKNRILGSVLVGAYHSDLSIEKEKLSGYFDTPWDFEAIKKINSGSFNLQESMILGFQLKKHASYKKNWIRITMNPSIRDILEGITIKKLFLRRLLRLKQRSFPMRKNESFFFFLLNNFIAHLHKSTWISL